MDSRPSAVAIEDNKTVPVSDNSEGAIEALDTIAGETVSEMQLNWRNLGGSLSKNKEWIVLWVSFLIRISFYTADWVLDIQLLIEYGTKGEWWYFGLTFVFVFVPAFLIYFINSMYYAKKEWADRRIRQTGIGRKAFVKDPAWIFPIRLLCLLGPIAKFIDIFRKGWNELSAKENCTENMTETKKKYREKDLNKKEKKNEMERLRVSQLLESLLESSPQLLLQVYIVAMKLGFITNDQSGSNFTSATNRTGPVTLINSNYSADDSSGPFIPLIKNNDQELMLQIGSILISLLSLSGNSTYFMKESLPSFYYHKRIRVIISWLSVFLAHFFTIASRAVILCFVAVWVNAGKIAVWVVIVIHCAVMLIVFPQKMHREQQQNIPKLKSILKWAQNALISSQILTILPVTGCRLWDYKRYTLCYYAICFVENTAMLIWFAVATYTDPAPTPLWLAVVIGQPVSFLSAFGLYFVTERNNDGFLRSAPSLEAPDTRLKQVELGSLCTKECLNEADFLRFKELVNDRKVDINYKSQDGSYLTPFQLLCSNKGTQRNGILLKCLKILFERKDFDVKFVNSNRVYVGSQTLCEEMFRHYQGNDLVDVMRLLIFKGLIEPNKIGQSSTFFNLYLEREEEAEICGTSLPVLDLCRFHEGSSLKETLKALIDDNSNVLTSKNVKGDNILTVLLGRSSQQNRRIDLVDIVSFVMEQGLHFYGSKWTDEIVNGWNKDGRNALHVLCSVYNENFIELARLLASNGIAGSSVDRKGWNALHILISSTDYNRADNLFQLVECLLNDCGIQVGSKNEKGETALDLLCENCNREQSDEHQLLLLPIIKLLVEQPKGGLELVQTGSPLYFYRLLQHYKGKDLVDIVKYFVIDKKMPFDKETAIYFLQHRNDLPNREEIEIILQNVVQ